jgi:hypothetical protein
MTRLFLILIWTMAPALGALAADKPASPSTRSSRVSKTSQGLILNFQNETVDAILEELCRTLGLKLVKDVMIVSRVSVISPNPISTEETWSLINVLVENTGFMVVQIGSDVKLVMKKNGQAVDRK